MPTPDVIGDQETHGLLPQRHDERDDLVSARPEGKFGKGAEGAGTVAEGEPGGIVEQAGGADVAEVGAGRRGEASVNGAVRADIEGKVDTGDFFVGAAEGFDDKQVVGVIRGQDHPLATAQGDQFAGLQLRRHFTFLKMSGR